MEKLVLEITRGLWESYEHIVTFEYESAEAFKRLFDSIAVDICIALTDNDEYELPREIQVGPIKLEPYDFYWVSEEAAGKKTDRVIRRYEPNKPFIYTLDEWFESRKENNAI